MDQATIYRKTAKGVQEVSERTHGLEKRVRRLLIMVDGNRDVAELSAFARAGEVEATLGQLETLGLIKAAGSEERKAGQVAYAPAANNPAVFAVIKRNAMVEIRRRLGAVSSLLIDEIDSCPGPLELRQKLRNIENALVHVLGPADGAELARRIGGELTKLVPQKDRDDSP